MFAHRLQSQALCLAGGFCYYSAMSNPEQSMCLQEIMPHIAGKTDEEIDSVAQANADVAYLHGMLVHPRPAMYMNFLVCQVVGCESICTLEKTVQNDNETYVEITSTTINCKRASDQ